MSAKFKILLVFTAALVACDSSDAEPSPKGETREASAKPAPSAAVKEEAKVQVSVPDGAKSTATEIASRFTEGQFDVDDETEANVDAFLWLASTHSDPAIAAQALRIAGDLATDDALGRLGTVVDARLRASDPNLVQAALVAASSALSDDATPKERMEAAWAHREHAEPSVRFALVELLWATGNEQGYRVRVLEMLDPGEEPVILAKALDPGRRLADKEARTAYIRKCTSLLQHPDAGVRGRAARALAVNADRDDEKVRAAIEALLSDPQPYPRVAAADALATMRSTASIAKMGKLLGDDASSKFSYDVPDPSSPRKMALSSNWPVRYKVLLSLYNLSSSMGDEGLPFKGGIDLNKKEDVEAKLKQARAWAKRHG